MINPAEQLPRNSSPVPAARRKPQGTHVVKEMEALEAANHDLRRLSAQLLQLQDQERRTIARHLNDATGQELAALSVNLGMMFRAFGNLDPELASGLLEAVRLTKHSCDELQTISYLLHPPLLDEMGLPMALRWFLDGFVKQSNIRVDLELSDNFGRLPRNLEIAVFRVAQEYLTEIHRHARSSTAAVRLYRRGGKIMLEVHDRENEMTEKPSQCVAASFGLRSVEERVKDFHGEIEIAALPGGTQVRVSIPVPESSIAP